MTRLADVAVLMPVYNGQAAAWRTLASFTETAPVRVLVVDDGSTPPFIAPTALPPGVSVEILRLSANGGIERALAAGVDTLSARGVRYVARIDAGDLSMPARLTRQRAYLENNARVGAVGMAARVVKRDGSEAFVLKPPTEAAVIRRLRFARSCLIHPSMMLRVEAVLAAGGYRVRYPAAEDLDLFLRIMRAYECANLPDIGVVYELNETGISASRRRAQIVSTLRLQIAYFEPGNPWWWLGFAKHLLHLVTPYRLLGAIKRFAYRSQASS
jgi:glycosyltransferase involved in cell wall biosynthesis